MAKVIWKENKIISIELRTGLFVLAQMAKDPYLIIYDCYTNNNEWCDLDLNDIDVLSCNPVTKQFTSSSNITTVKNVKPFKYNELPKYWIKLDALGSRHVKLWKNTENEITVLMLGKGGGELVEKDIVNNNKKKTIIDNIPFSDYETINKYELTSVRTYPEFNERLYYCYLLRKNVDPLKDLVFNKEISLDYKVYMKILNGEIKKDEWISLPL